MLQGLHQLVVRNRVEVRLQVRVVHLTKPGVEVLTDRVDEWMLSFLQEFDGKPMTVGNGVMVALGAKDKAEVDRIYKLALSLGGTDEGPPGPRGEGFYAAYFRDLDGNKLNAFVMG